MGADLRHGCCRDGAGAPADRWRCAVYSTRNATLRAKRWRAPVPPLYSVAGACLVTSICLSDFLFSERERERERDRERGDRERGDRDRDRGGGETETGRECVLWAFDPNACFQVDLFWTTILVPLQHHTWTSSLTHSAHPSTSQPRRRRTWSGLTSTPCCLTLVSRFLVPALTRCSPTRPRTRKVLPCTPDPACFSIHRQGLMLTLLCVCVCLCVSVCEQLCLGA